jgi:hypothetical protein
MDGTVTRAGQPLAGTVIIAASRGAMRSMFFVITGKDGTFGLDQLAPGGYLVQAMVGSGGGKPKDLHAVSVTVQAGQRVKAELEVLSGPINMGIAVQTEEGAPVAAAQVALMSIAIDAETFAQMREKGPPEGAHGSMFLRVAMGGQPAMVNGIPPGTYTACASPLPVDPNDPQAMQQLPPDIVEALPMKCTPAPVAASPATQQVIVKVPAAWTKPKPQ